MKNQCNIIFLPYFQARARTALLCYSILCLHFFALSFTFVFIELPPSCVSIFLPPLLPQLCLSPLCCHHSFKNFLPFHGPYSFNTFVAITLPLRCHHSSFLLPPILSPLRLHNRTTLHSLPQP